MLTFLRDLVFWVSIKKSWLFKRCRRGDSFQWSSTEWSKKVGNGEKGLVLMFLFALAFFTNFFFGVWTFVEFGIQKQHLFWTLRTSAFDTKGQCFDRFFVSMKWTNQLLRWLQKWWTVWQQTFFIQCQTTKTILQRSIVRNQEEDETHFLDWFTCNNKKIELEALIFVRCRPRLPPNCPIWVMSALRKNGSKFKTFAFAFAFYCWKSTPHHILESFRSCFLKRPKVDT